MWCPSLSLLSTIVGGLNIIISIAAAIFCTYFLCVYDQLEFEKADFDDNSNYGLITIIVMLVFFLICLLFSILLVIGIYKRHHRLMGFWIYFNMICMVLLVLDAVVEFIRDLVNGLPFSQTFLDFVLTCFILGIYALCFYPVYKLFRHMRASPELSKRSRKFEKVLRNEKL